MMMKEYQFPSPYPDGTEHRGYKIFPDKLENHELTAFHGTDRVSFLSIKNDGFLMKGNLQSISFAKKSNLPLGYACKKREETRSDAIVIAVKFANLNEKYIREEIDIIYLDDINYQPEIIGYCVVPNDYEHI